MRLAGIAPVALAIVLTVLLQGCDGSTEPQPVSQPGPQPEVRVTAITPISLTGTVGADVQPAPTVRATDEHGQPLAGVAITFKVTTGGGTISSGSVTTAADGSASLAKWTLGTAPGSQTVAAGAGGKSDVVFTALATAGPVAQITPASGNNQLAGVGQVLEKPLVAFAADTFGNPVSGIPVAFTVIAGGGTVVSDVVLTGATGMATAGDWTLGAEIGVQQVAAVSGSALAVFQAFAAPPPGTLQGKIAFASVTDSGVNMAVVNADGSSLTTFAQSAYVSAPAWSPDGSLIAFTDENYDSETDVSLYEIALITADGANVSRLTEGPIDYSPAWSPDGTAIAFTSWVDGRPYLASLDMADRRVTLLTPTRDAQPSWSPDGSRLAFVSDEVGVQDIFTANPDGSGQVQLTTERYASHPAWSPDGSMIAFLYRGEIAQGEQEFRVALMAADGVFLKDLASAGIVHFDDVGSLAWSPDGSGIAYSSFSSFSDCDCTSGHSIKFVSLDGSRQVTLIRDAVSPSWHR
jgi:Tol biopolymer transport system component